MKKNKILLISPTPTHPRTAGNRARVESLLNGLKQLGHDVYFCHVQSEKGDDEEMRKAWGERYFSIPYSRPRKQRSIWNKKVKALFDPNARYIFSIDEWYDPTIDVSISQLKNKYRFDAVMVEYVFFSRVLNLFGKDVLKIIDTHDVFADRHLKYLKNGQRPRWYSTTRREEAKGLNRADIVIAIQEMERVYFSQLTSKKVVTVGHTVEIHNPSGKQATGKRILFVASDNPINIDGINHFIAEIFPYIRREVPEAELTLAGSVCSVVTEQAGIVKLGRVEDLAPVYEASSIVINPVRISTGLSIKNLEALGYSKPLVTYPAGAEGLGEGGGSAYLVAGDPEQFSRNIVCVLTDVSYARELASKAHGFAVQRNDNTLKRLGDIFS